MILTNNTNNLKFKCNKDFDMINDWCSNHQMVINNNISHYLLPNIHYDVIGLFSFSFGSRGL